MHLFEGLCNPQIEIFRGEIEEKNRQIQRLQEELSEAEVESHGDGARCLTAMPGRVRSHATMASASTEASPVCSIAMSPRSVRMLKNLDGVLIHS